MVLIDTSIWIDHFRAADERLTALLSRNEVLTHPFVVGEIALGSIARRNDVLHLMRNLPAAVVATSDEVMAFIERQRLYRAGVGYVDVALLAATALTPNALLWSKDKNLGAAAARCGLGHS